MINEQTAILNERAKFKINFGNTPVEHEFWICKFRDVDMILGNDFFMNLKEIEEKQSKAKKPIKIQRKIETEDQTADNSTESDEEEISWNYNSNLHSSKSVIRERADIDITQLIPPAILEGLWTETEQPTLVIESGSCQQSTEQAENPLNTIKKVDPEISERTYSTIQNTEGQTMDSLHHNQVLKPIKFNSHKGQKRRKVWHSTRPPDVNNSKHQKKTNLFQTKNKRSRDKSLQILFLNDCSSRMRTEFTQYWMYAKENPGPRSI